MPTLSDLEKRLAEFTALRDTCAAQLDAAAYILWGAPGYWTPARATAETMEHVNALAAELARTEPPAHPHRDTGPR